MKTLKKLLPVILGLVLVLSFSFTAYASQVNVTVNDQPVYFEGQGPAVVEGRTLVPVRGVFETLGFEVEWNDVTGIATLTSDDYVVVVTIGSSTFTTNGASHTLDVSAQIIGGRTMLPIRFVLESVGYTMDWDDATRTVIISYESTINLATDPTDLPSADDALQLRSDARYFFEQIYLPHVVYGLASDAVIDYLNNMDAVGMEGLLVVVWDVVTEIFMEDAIDDGIITDSVQRDEVGLESDHIVDVTVEVISEDTVAFIIKMLDINQFLISTYIAVVYSDEKLQIFTLEQSLGFHMFCFVNVDSRGPLFPVDNNREAFIEAIKYFVNVST